MHVDTTAIHKANKDLMLDMLSQHQNWYIQKDLCLGHSKFSTTTEAMIVVCFLSLLFKEILHDDVVFVWGWHLLNISALKCSVYSRAGFNWRNTEFVKYLHVNSVVPEIKYWQWGDIGETFTIQTVYFVVAKVKFLWIANHSHYE